MSDSSSGGEGANMTDMDNINKGRTHSDKGQNEREQSYIEELAGLINVNFPQLADSDNSSNSSLVKGLEKGSILQETIEKLKKIQSGSRDIQLGEVSSSQSVLPKEILGSLVLEATDGFMFVVNNDGKKFLLLRFKNCTGNVIELT